MIEILEMTLYNDFNVYCRELARGTVCLTGDRAQGDDSKQCAYSSTALQNKNQTQNPHKQEEQQYKQ